jgi:hypothetical protein
MITDLRQKLRILTLVVLVENVLEMTYTILRQKKRSGNGKKY